MSSKENDLFTRVQSQKVDDDFDPLATMFSTPNPTPSPASKSPASSTSSSPRSSVSATAKISESFLGAPTTPGFSSFSSNSIGGQEILPASTASSDHPPKPNFDIYPPSDLATPSVKHLSINKTPKEKTTKEITSSSQGSNHNADRERDVSFKTSQGGPIAVAANSNSNNSSSSNSSNITVKATSIAARPSAGSNSVVVQATNPSPSTRLRERDPNIDTIPLLTGEVEECIVPQSVVHIGKKSFEGITFVTNYRLYFHISSTSSLRLLASISPSMFNYLNVPLGCVERVDRDRRISPKDHNICIYTMTVFCKDIRKVVISMQGKIGGPEETMLDWAISSICKKSFCSNIRNAFAFSHSLPSEPLSITRVEPYNARKEFDRQGIMTRSNSFLRFSNANSGYAICSSYPKLLVVPTNIEDRSLSSIAQFRAGGRLPVLSWGDKHNGATIWRCSQPKIGPLGNTCDADQRFLDEIARSCSTRKDPLGKIKSAGRPQLHIVDCRPKASAVANLVAGYGFESSTNCNYSTLEFYDIGNIHVMRDSLRGIYNLAMSSKPDNDDIYFSKQIESTEWLSHVRCVLRASLETAEQIRKGVPVLVHCSHGWDRTAQVCSLAQLFLDSYFRTMEGFKVLVEKEFNSYGHQFNLRCQHLCDKARIQGDQVSPIFLQFLDCVWQIVKQYPQYFEFNTRYILSIADHIYSCRFGTFLFNEDRDRDNFQCDLCVDLWTYLHYNRKSFLNPLFLDPNDEDNLITTHVLMPMKSQLLRGVSIWSEYYFRYSPMNSNHCAPEHLHQFLFQNIRSNPIGSISVSNFISSSQLSQEHDESVLKLPDFHLFPLVSSEDLWESVCRAQVLQGTSTSPTGTSPYTGGGGGGSDSPVTSVGGSNYFGKANIADVMQTLVLKNETIDRQQEIILRLTERLRTMGVSEEEFDTILNQNIDEPGAPSALNLNATSGGNAAPLNANDSNLITSVAATTEGRAGDLNSKYLLDDDYDSQLPNSRNPNILPVLNDNVIPVVPVIPTAVNSSSSSSSNSSSSGGVGNVCISPSGKTYVIVDDDDFGGGEETEGEFL